MSKQESKFSSMDSLVSGFVLDPEKCNKLILEGKRKLVHKIAQWSEDAPRVLSSLTRGELLEIICAEMGKERKYSGYTKSRMIDHLLKLVYRNSMKKNTGDSLAFFPTEIEPVPKRQKKQGQPIQQATVVDHASSENIKEAAQFLLCQNLACRAILSPENGFCKRCSCCICYQYDDNKDPSLWLTCESDSPLEGNLCGMSCHLKCALEHERAGILKNGSRLKLDGSFYCVCCGKNNGLMRTWKRQLLVAKEARRVDVLCLRISLSCKILARTKQYEALQKIVQTASKKLENEVGPLDQACTKMDRGIVNRLSCGAEVQKLCILAVEAFDSMFSDPCYPRVDEDKPPTLRISFEELSPTTVTVVLEYDDHLLEECLGCKLWHRKSTAKDYPKGATYYVMKPRKRFKLANLSPSTEYSCKVTLFSDTRTLGVWEAIWVTPASSKRFISLLDDQNGNKEHSLIVTPHPNNSVVAKQFAELQSLDCLNKHDESLVLPNIPFGGSASDPPSTPCKSDKRTEVSGLSGKKRPEKSDYEYSVHVIKWLEHEGHIERDFRVKFLTWFSLKAAMRDRRVASVFIDTMIDDPPSLAGQLIDTFSEEICSDHKPVSRPRFCTRFWH